MAGGDIPLPVDPAPAPVPDPNFVGPPVPPVSPTRCTVPSNDVFSLCANTTNYNDIYCCPFGDNGFITEDNIGFANGPGCTNFTFPIKNDDDQPMLKSALNGTTQFPWVRISFQEYLTPSGGPS